MGNLITFALQGRNLIKPIFNSSNARGGEGGGKLVGHLHTIFALQGKRWWDVAQNRLKHNIKVVLNIFSTDDRHMRTSMHNHYQVSLLLLFLHHQNSSQNLCLLICQLKTVELSRLRNGDSR